MIQRFIYTAIKEGLQQVADDPTLLDDLFGGNLGLEASEIAAIKTMFAAKPPAVHHGYARQDYEFPLYSIILASEGEIEHFLGNDAAPVFDEEDPDYGTDIQTSIYKHAYHILCYAEHPDVVTYIYEFAKAVFLAQGDYFDSVGLFEVNISGMDLAPDPRYVPENLFVRQIMFECQREFCRVDRDSKLGKAFKVRGIHVDKSGSPSDVGGVQTLVTPYSANEEEG